jgi:hypothetical protein
LFDNDLETTSQGISKVNGYEDLSIGVVHPLIGSQISSIVLIDKIAGIVLIDSNEQSTRQREHHPTTGRTGSTVRRPHDSPLSGTTNGDRVVQGSDTERVATLCCGVVAVTPP